MKKKYFIIALIAVLLAIFAIGCVEKPTPVGETPTPAETVTETTTPTPTETTVSPEVELQKAIDHGRELFNDSSLGTTGDTCSTCHLESGTKTNPEQMMGFTIKAFNKLNTVYPKYWPMTNKVMSLDQVNNFCKITPLNGTPFKWDDQNLTDLTAYIASVESGIEEAPMTEDEKAKYQESVDRGKALFNDPSLGTTGDTCSTCHIENGTKTNPEQMMGFTIKAFDNIGEKYPKYWLMTKKVMTLEQVINFCLTNPLEGEALSLEDQKLADLTAYITSVKSHGESTETTPSPSGKTNPYWGEEGAIAEGKEIFNKNCSSCHGSDGKGRLSGQPDFTDASYWAGKTDEDLFKIVSEGKNGMPSFKESLSDDEIWKVLAYEKSFSE